MNIDPFCSPDQFFDLDIPTHHQHVVVVLVVVTILDVDVVVIIIVVVVVVVVIVVVVVDVVGSVDDGVDDRENEAHVPESRGLTWKTKSFRVKTTF